MTEETLFELALNTPESERKALLDRQCGDDQGLLQRVNALLEAHFRNGSRFPCQAEETIDAAPGSSAADQHATSNDQTAATN